MSRQPNILFMHSHNTGQFIQPYGHGVPTPNLQRLAEEGVLFRKAFAAAPTCSPSRSAFLSGMYAHTNGMLGLAHRGFVMADYDYHAARHLKAHGYLTAVAGVEHTAPNPDIIGYDTILSSLDPNYPDAAKNRPPAEAVVEFLQNPPAAPFFLSLGLKETHRPFPKADPANHPAEVARYCMPPRPLPDTPETREDTADFKASARLMDDQFGLVLDALDARGLADNTLVFCFSDHGLQFPRHMCNLTDHGIAVYLFVRGPGGFRGGKEINAMVSLIDMLPTAYQVAGIPTPVWVQGKSFLPLVSGQATEHRSEIFAEVNYHAAYEPMRCVRTKRYKYIRRYDRREKLVLPNVDDTLSKSFLLSHDWAAQLREQEMLFDLIFDPDESNNLIKRPDLADVKAELSHKLDTWMQQTNDPILATGHVPAPEGAVANDPDGSSPNEATVSL